MDEASQNTRGVVLELGSTATNGKSIAQYIRRMKRDGEDPKLRKTSGREGVMRSLGQFIEDYGDRQTLLSNLWPFRDRLVVTFDGAPHGMFRIHAMGFVPDIVYVDTDKYLTSSGSQQPFGISILAGMTSSGERKWVIRAVCSQPKTVSLVSLGRPIGPFWLGSTRLCFHIPTPRSPLH